MDDNKKKRKKAPAFVGLGFRFRTVRGYRHYQVVRRSADEMRVMRHRLPGGDGEDGGDDS